MKLKRLELRRLQRLRRIQAQQSTHIYTATDNSKGIESAPSTSFVPKEISSIPLTPSDYRKDVNTYTQVICESEEFYEEVATQCLRDLFESKELPDIDYTALEADFIKYSDLPTEELNSEISSLLKESTSLNQ